jgi:hypothetical protein
LLIEVACIIVLLRLIKRKLSDNFFRNERLINKCIYFLVLCFLRKRNQGEKLKYVIYEVLSIGGIIKFHD